MRISGLHIDGFGLFHDFGLRDLPSGLAVFTGDNESGKTTLMQFVRTVLFGFPVRREPYNDYSPLRGGNHGGRLLVEMQDGRRLTIERVGKQATIAPEGAGAQLGDPSALLMGGIDQKTFERIFAIGLKDLEGLDILTQEGVRGRLFAASAGLGTVPLSQVQAGLDKQREELLKPQGRDQRINRLLHDRREKQEEIKRLQGQAAEYASLQSEHADLEAKVREERLQEGHLRRRLLRLDQLARAREAWLTLREARGHVAGLEFARSFPAQGLERLDRLQTNIEELTQTQATSADRSQALQREMDNLTVDEAVLAQAEAIEALVAEREHLRSAAQDCPTRTSEVHQAGQDMNSRLGELGPAWTVESLEEVDTSVQVRREVQEKGRALGTLERRSEEARHAAEAAQKAEQDAIHELRTAESALTDLPSVPAQEVQSLPARRSAIRRLRPLLGQLEGLGLRLEDRRRALQEATDRLDLLAKDQAAPSPFPSSFTGGTPLTDLPSVPAEEVQSLPARRSAIRRLRPLLGQLEGLGLRLEERRRAQQEASDRLNALTQSPVAPTPFPSWLTWGAPVLSLVLAAVSAAQQAWVVAAVLVVLAPAVGIFVRRARARAAASEASRQAAWERDRSLAEQAQERIAQEVGDLESGERAKAEEIARIAQEANLTVPSDSAALEAAVAALDSLEAAISEASRRVAWERDHSIAEQAQERIAQEVRDLESGQRAKAEEIVRIAHEANLAVPSDSAALEAAAATLDSLEEQQRARSAGEHDCAEAEKRLTKAQGARQPAEEQYRKVREELERFQEEWTAWLAERGFASGLRPEAFEVVVQAVELARQASRSLGERRERLERLRTYLEQTQNRLREILSACGREPTSEVGVADLDALRRALQEAQTAHRQEQDMNRQLSDAQGEWERSTEQLKEKQEERAALFAQAGSPDEEAFRRSAEEHTDLLTCEQTIQINEHALRTIAGTAEAQEALEQELVDTDELEVRSEQQRLTRELSEVEQIISEADQALGGCKRRISEMDQDARLSSLLLEERGLEEQMRDAVKSWAVLSVCRQFLADTQAVYERERQPQVILDAGELVQTITSGRYRLIASLEGSEVQLEDAVLARKREVQWSDGLADQVYLSMRLALAKGFGRHAEPLPVILDDVLLKFDPVRGLAAARAILDFACEQQVLLFSCHPEIAETVRAAASDVTSSGPPVAWYEVSDGEVSQAVVG
jgi:uncharacterized protein YhaN